MSHKKTKAWVSFISNCMAAQVNNTTMMSKLCFSIDWHFSLFSGNQSQWHLELVITETNHRPKTDMSFSEKLDMMQIYHKLLMLGAYAYRLHRGKAKMPGKWNSNKTESLGSV